VNELFKAARDVDALISRLQLPHCIIGGLAVNRWGRPRATQDVDFAVLVDFGREREVGEAILADLRPRISDALQFAVVNRVLLAETDSGVPIDIGLAGFPFEEAIISRATGFEFDEGVVVPTVSAEDLIVLKAIAGRGHDWSDIEGIIVRQSDRLDWEMISDQLSALADLLPEADPLARLGQMRSELAAEEDDEES
jgi:hypothetical protein